MKLLSKQRLHLLLLLSRISLCVASIQGFSVHNDLLAFPQYKVIISEAPIRPEDAENLLSNQAGHQEEDEELAMNLDVEFHSGERKAGRDTYERMIFQNQSFLCTIPYVPPKTTQANNTTTSEEEQAKELIRATDRGWELLEGMKENCIYYAAGWWVYSFCYDDGIKQFHPMGIPVWPPTPDPNSHSYVLGRFGEEVKAQEIDAPASPDAASELQTMGETNYLVQRLGGGTMCDLTGVERKIEVQYHCNPSQHERINLIKETASCVYLMVIHTPRLCNDIAFRPPQGEQPHTIFCQEIVSNEDYPEWSQRKTDEAERDIFVQAVAENPTKPLIIGGIEVGAQKLVGGTPDRSLKVPLNVGSHGQKEIFLGTVASSDGKYNKILSDREIKNLGIKASKADIEHSVHEMEEFAGGKPWELNVIKTPEGLKIVGVTKMEDDDEDETDSSLKDTTERKEKPTRSWRGNKPEKTGKKMVKAGPQGDEDNRYYAQENQADGEERGKGEEFR